MDFNKILKIITLIALVAEKLTTIFRKGEKHEEKTNESIKLEEGVQKEHRNSENELS